MPFSAIEDRGVQVFSQDHVARLLEQIAELVPGFSRFDFLQRVVCHVYSIPKRST
jgi:hypothetical protein